MILHLQSPDLNIMSVWDYIKRPKTLKLIKSTEQQWYVLQDDWNNQLAMCTK